MDLIRSEDVLDDVVKQFVVDAHGYFAYAASGLTLTIVRALSVQPPIADDQDYYTYLWVESVNGFFLLRQQVLQCAAQSAQEWVVVRRIEPNDTFNFFFEFLDGIEEYVKTI
jgi:hypothetical protein